MKTLFIAFAALFSVTAFASGYEVQIYQVRQAPMLLKNGYGFTEMYTLVNEFKQPNKKRIVSLTAGDPGHLLLNLGPIQNGDNLIIGSDPGDMQLVDFRDTAEAIRIDMMAVKNGDFISIARSSKDAILCFYPKGGERTCHYEYTIRW